MSPPPRPTRAAPPTGGRTSPADTFRSMPITKIQGASKRRVISDMKLASIEGPVGAIGCTVGIHNRFLYYLDNV